MTVDPDIVAHRGWATRHPENSLAAIESALAAGVRHVEFDVQLSSDGMPVLIHDPTLDRTAGRSGCVMDLPWSELKRVEVRSNEPGPPRDTAPLPALFQVVALLADYPAATAFVELKTESIERFGGRHCVGRCLETLAPVQPRSVLTSFDERALTTTRELSAMPVAWALARYDEASLARARTLAPEFLFCNHRKLPEDDAPLPSGPWSWVIYEVRTAALARALAARGVAYVETMAVGELMDALAD